MKELRELRRASGLTQYQIAERMGCCRQRIVQIEGGERVSAATERRFREAVRAAVAVRERLSKAIRAAVEADDNFENLKMGER